MCGLLAGAGVVRSTRETSPIGSVILCQLSKLGSAVILFQICLIALLLLTNTSQVFIEL